MGGNVTRAIEPFAQFPYRFIDAEMRGDLSERQAKLCRYIVRHGNEKKRETRLTLAAIRGGVRWEGSDDTLLRELKSLRPEWIDYESRPGQRSPYVIRWTGLAVVREGDEKLRPETATSARPPHDLRKSAPHPPPHDRSAETGETRKPSGKTPPQKPPNDSEGAPLPLTSTEGSEVKAASEEKLDHVVGKTTAAEFDRHATDRILAIVNGDRPVAWRRTRTGRSLGAPGRLRASRRSWTTARPSSMPG